MLVVGLFFLFSDDDDNGENCKIDGIDLLCGVGFHTSYICWWELRGEKVGGV